jgi:peptidyl-prolyl cis-trans isomerase A (cyclophilin A)
MSRARNKGAWILFTAAVALIFSTFLARASVALLANGAALAPDEKKEGQESQKKDDEKKKAEEKKVTESAKTEPSKTTQPHPALMDPSQANEKAPEQFQVKFETTKGDFVIEVTREWAPIGADRFYNLVKIGYFSDLAFFRVIPDFMVQFGIHGDPKVSTKWRAANIKDDPVKQSNQRGYISFATAGANTRTTQLFINFKDNVSLDRMGFSAFGQVIDGMKVVDSIYSGYGEGAPRGRGPDQGSVQSQGNEYLKKSFPMLDYIKKVTVVKEKKDSTEKKESK